MNIDKLNKLLKKIKDKNGKHLFIEYEDDGLFHAYRLDDVPFHLSEEEFHLDDNGGFVANKTIAIAPREGKLILQFLKTPKLNRFPHYVVKIAVTEVDSIRKCLVYEKYHHSVVFIKPSNINQYAFTENELEILYNDLEDEFGKQIANVARAGTYQIQDMPF